MKFVYKATGKPVKLGDTVVLRDGQGFTVDYFREPHKPDSEGKVTLLAEGAQRPHGTEFYASVIGAEWIEREDRYNNAGHVCPETGRIAMTVADAYAREDMPDRHFTLYNEEAADMGLEAWRMIDGMDATTQTGDDGRPVGYTLDFASGRSLGVPPSSIVYMQRTKAERDPRFIIDAENASGMRVSFRNVPGNSATEAAACALSTMKTPSDWRMTGTDREAIAS